MKFISQEKLWSGLSKSVKINRMINTPNEQLSFTKKYAFQERILKQHIFF